MDARLALCLVICAIYPALADEDIITEPRPGEEYVLVSSGQQTPLRNFETSHKIPEKHPNHRIIKPDDTNDKVIKKLLSSKNKYPTEGIVSIEEDKKALFKKGQKSKVSESIEIDVPVSKLEEIKIKENFKDVETNPKMAVALEAMSESGKLSSESGTTTQKPVLTTSAPTSTQAYDYIPINFDTIDDINSGLLSSNVKLETAGSEQKQHSRIQIKKGPSGQDYEYEYIYYYYDEDDESKKETKDKGTKTTTESAVQNSHDGPPKIENENQIAKDIKGRSKYSTIDRNSASLATTPEAQNEVTAAQSRGRSRGRNVAPAPVEEDSEEDRLPSSTRFPPRGRNLAATSTTAYVPEVTSEAIKQRGRPQVDNVADESIGQTRSRTRAHIRRPSSELVDLDSFKTHSGDIPAPYKEQPSRYSSESKTTTELSEVTTKEISHAKESAREGHSLPAGIRFQEILDDSKLPPDYKQTTTYEQETTEYTTMTAMEKVALDLYAYVTGENLNNEISPAGDLLGFDGSTTVDDGAWTTEPMSTTEEETTPTTTTSTTTTTTTTTTTPAPTTTTTTVAPTRPSRFKGRPGARPRASVTTLATSAATEAPQETSTRVRGRFGKPNGVRKTTAAAVEASTAASAASEKPATQPKAFGRRGLFAGRTRPSTTTPAPAQDASSAASETPAPRPRLRPGLRKVSSTTAVTSIPEEPAGSTSPSVGSGEVAETTPTPSRTIGRKPGLRPASLRPGPRLNLRPSSRLRPGASSVAPAESASEAPDQTSAPEAPATEASPEGEGSSPTTPPEQPRGGIKLRNRLPMTPFPKTRVAVTAPTRRPNPLLRRKQPSTEATTEAAKKASSETTEDSTSAEKSETETEPAVVETTQAPLRGLDALLARRRNAGRPGRPVRGAQHPK